MKNKKVYFVLTVDTEEEWDWGGNFPEGSFSVQNTGCIPKFQKFCNERGVKPTYFVDYAIASDAESVSILKEPFINGKCEIGAHMHPWCTPPVEEEINPDNSHIVNLPLDLVRRKLRNLTRKIEDEFGERPVSFRSGRWGMNGELLNVLREEGYRTDSSVLPFYEDPAFSYLDAPDMPYWPDLDCITRKGAQREIFEMPASSGFNFKNFLLCNKIYGFLNSGPIRPLRIAGILSRLQIFKKVMVSPELSDASEMISCIKACLRRGHSIIHMFLHSSSLLKGAAPYVKTDEDEDRFYGNMAEVIDYLKTNTDVSFCTLTEAKKIILEEDL